MLDTYTKCLVNMQVIKHMAYWQVTPGSALHPSSFGICLSCSGSPWAEASPSMHRAGGPIHRGHLPVYHSDTDCSHFPKILMSVTPLTAKLLHVKLIYI